MLGIRCCLCAGAVLVFGFFAKGADLRLSDDTPLRLPPVGSYQLRVLAPSLLELTLVTAKKPESGQPEQWNFVNDKGQCRLPMPKEVTVSADGKVIAVTGFGFKRRAIY